MESLAYITLDMQAPALAVVVYAKQNDRLSRKIVAQLVDGSRTWAVPNTSSGVIRYKKPDGTTVFYDVDEDSNPALVVSGSIVTMTLAEQALTVPGDVYCELNFYDGGGGKLTTFSWLLRVQESVLPDSTIVSSSYYNVLTTQVTAAVQAAEEAVSLVSAAAGAVRFDVAQTLSSAQKTQARANIDAVDAAGAAAAAVPFHVVFNTTDPFTTQADALTQGGTWTFDIPFNNADMPTTTNSWVGFIQFENAYPNYKSVLAMKGGNDTEVWRLNKQNGTWGSWTRMAMVPDLTSWNFEPNNTSTLTSQIDALPASVHFATFYILSSGHQSATGMPTNANFYGFIFRASTNYVKVFATAVDSTTTIHVLNKFNGTWGTWSTNS